MVKSTLIRIAIFLVAVVCIVSIVTIRFQGNDLLEKYRQLEEKKENLQNKVDLINAELEKPFDEEYVARIAKEKLGLRYPQEIVFYGDNN